MVLRFFHAPVPSFCQSPLPCHQVSNILTNVFSFGNVFLTNDSPALDGDLHHLGALLLHNVEAHLLADIEKADMTEEPLTDFIGDHPNSTKRTIFLLSVSASWLVPV